MLYVIVSSSLNLLRVRTHIYSVGIGVYFVRRVFKLKFVSNVSDGVLKKPGTNSSTREF